ncbi:outer membrane beta-barrel protein [Thiocapsa rosea]|uniref:Outer membrane protein with beta-barrel domain n=1 Tax=Thiocapsa rosea TaxID=69360 RepID=A0A495V6I4_9GAMM|nr:outer membrane beta-barrel protein [Thiocapsa rosea]RKT44884.1 outer membrane protein with beta-barrel domain [Thiocapsa rosea]
MEYRTDQVLPSFDDRWYIAPFAAYTWADQGRGTDDGVGYGLSVGKPINEWFNLELRGTFTKLVSENLQELSESELNELANAERTRGYQGTGDFEVGDLAIDGLFFFNRGKVQPFLLGGLGVISDDFSCDRTEANTVGGCENASSKLSFMAGAGAGVLVPVSEYVSLRVDGRYRYDDNSADIRNESDFGDWIVTAGVSIAIGTGGRPSR